MNGSELVKFLKCVTGHGWNSRKQVRIFTKTDLIPSKPDQRDRPSKQIKSHFVLLCQLDYTKEA